ncbi:hypothetical protein PR048_011221 [Dryococelus australis]|uniref:HTH psq-type domain-containing protein n=1 Tax=Dryococelus australis TaxID=614101 RepID=A0ABQ9HLH3_9NEOP|nr:hypothetical protein PR048_011221 [Dryococelus australis]
MRPVLATRKSLTLSEKIAGINEAEKGVKKNSEIAEDFVILPNTLSDFLINTDKILNTGNSIGNDRKTTRGPENPKVDECVLKWFKQV